MSEDFAHSFNLENDHIAFHRALAELEDFVIKMGGNQLVRYGLPQPERDAAERAGVDYRRETPYSVDEEKEVAVQNTNRLNEEQRAVHDEFVAAFNTSSWFCSLFLSMRFAFLCKVPTFLAPTMVPNLPEPCTDVGSNHCGYFLNKQLGAAQVCVNTLPESRMQGQS
ncbi:hypothetical protein RRG08_015817 [Elysia crispata]|uniref:Uncharacterized protein n=1 Tax=Elysia crispata TaxID=231223 RepID=A0AAE1DQK6_9GAST|nr:hypothetical protein RRG08_015817 [Elysia crispata]